MDTVQEKCRVSIMRQAMSYGSARTFIIYVDNVKAAEIRNGGIINLLLDQGQHTISFGLGSKIESNITLDLIGGGVENIICHSINSGIEAFTTPADVCSSMVEPPSSTTSQPAGTGCLASILIAVGLFLFFSALVGIVWK